MTQILQPSYTNDELLEYDRSMLRSVFVSLFWSVIAYKKRHEGFKLKTLAGRIGVNKSAPSRWFSGARPNWTLNTISDIANVLNVDLVLSLRDRTTGRVFAPHGMVESTSLYQAPATSAKNEIDNDDARLSGRTSSKNSSIYLFAA